MTYILIIMHFTLQTKSARLKEKIGTTTLSITVDIIDKNNSQMRGYGKQK